MYALAGVFGVWEKAFFYGQIDKFLLRQLPCCIEPSHEKISEG